MLRRMCFVVGRSPIIVALWEFVDTHGYFLHFLFCGADVVFNDCGRFLEDCVVIDVGFVLHFFLLACCVCILGTICSALILHWR